MNVKLRTVSTFADVIESVENLSLEEQEDLVSIVQRRVRDQRRAELVRAVTAARKEFAAGNCKPATAAEIIQMIKD